MDQRQHWDQSEPSDQQRQCGVSSQIVSESSRFCLSVVSESSSFCGAPLRGQRLEPSITRGAKAGAFDYDSAATGSPIGRSRPRVFGIKKMSAAATRSIRRLINDEMTKPWA